MSSFTLMPVEHDTMDTAQSKLAKVGRVQIDGFLASSEAMVLRDSLEQAADWRHVLNAGDKVYEIADADVASMADPERRTLETTTYRSAETRFQFRYDTIRIPDDEIKLDSEDTPLHAFARFLNSSDVIAYWRSVTGCDRIDFVDCQATRYRLGDFLTRHDDAVEGKNRLFAYVLGLSEDWRADWGGLLLFADDRDQLIDAFSPRFNALSLFSVGQPHSVSMVTPFAGRSRLSVTGWLRSKPDSE